MLLLRFVCSFAWVDLEVRPEEREFVSGLIRRLGLREDERAEVEAWLADPPPLDSVDPALVPKEHRMRFVRAVESVIAVDREISAAEQEQLLIFARLLR
jgi:hypothetical protein